MDSSVAESRIADQEAELRRQLPGWEAWPIRTHDGKLLWSAQPEGAKGAVFTQIETPKALRAAVREYMRDLDTHIVHARQRLADCPPTGIGRDRAAVLEALITALENMSARQHG